MRRASALLLLFFGTLVVTAAQAPREFRARLSPVPIDLAMMATIGGTGSATATLTGNKLTINGTFSGLKSPATVARLHVAEKGLRGAAILDLTVETATRGTLRGSFDLTKAQLSDLTAGRFYLQIHSEKAPEGNLRGWLLSQDKKQ